MTERELREAYAWAGTLRGSERDHWLTLMVSSERNGAIGERKAVVAWMRAQVSCGCGRSDCYTDRFPLNHAKAIEDGEHIK